MNKLREKAQEWVKVAENDLNSAKRLLFDDEPIRDTGCFHCQQAAEKMLKAYLVKHGIKFPKTHLLSYLIDLCSDKDKEFETLREQAELLTAYAVGVRYADDWYEPDGEESQAAWEAANKIFNFVSSRL